LKLEAEVSTAKSFSTMYFVLAIFGLCATWYYNIQYFAQGDAAAFSTYLQSALVNLVTTGITVDVYFSACVFSIWVLRESTRVGLQRFFVYIALCFGIGLAFALPLFLAFREIKMMQDNQYQLRSASD
jgi:Terpene cyclase DEP1